MLFCKCRRRVILSFLKFCLFMWFFCVCWVLKFWRYLLGLFFIVFFLRMFFVIRVGLFVLNGLLFCFRNFFWVWFLVLVFVSCLIWWCLIVWILLYLLILFVVFKVLWLVWMRVLFFYGLCVICVVMGDWNRGWKIEVFFFVGIVFGLLYFLFLRGICRFFWIVV